MNAIDLLESQHRKVEDLFKRIKKAEDEKGEIVEQLASAIVGHDAIEREGALETAPDRDAPKSSRKAAAPNGPRANESRAKHASRSSG